ncbi:FimV/HubP family polar landmark protein [Pseudomonas sp. GW456-12-1-14-TSB6]|uniref:FimV/HubP family polar landmark protein n=1 Tax=Pseudomonas sp. GW456-12-1-14-TSB6 TaxID=2751350 RepID=UPI000CD0CD5D|nr:FimV/HubP family polar landmark protein [Pseudomonas sp. GW456-12-1-14-TSB6]POA38780.1 peptidoglycan-binding protein LysM [Pseudomonas sp. GW456-12-1-14-TSB6]
MLGSRHVVKRCANSLLVAGVLTWSTASLALGLGDITVHSALNQPLKADIALVDVGGVSESELAVRLASADEFGRAGIERVFFLNDLKFTPILRGNRNMIRVTSTKPVNEPFLNFLVQLDQPNGHLVREYTVLIDPPGSPGIVPATDEPTARAQSSEFPTPETPTATTPAKPAASVQPPAPVADAQAEQLAASLVQNQQLQKTIDELNAKLQAQEVLIADGKKQLGDLQARLIEVQQAPPAPVAPVAPVPAPVIAPVESPEDSLNWPLLGGLLLVLGLLVAGLYVRRHRQQEQGAEAPTPFLPVRNEPPVDDAEPMQPSAAHSAVEHREEHANGDVLEAVGIYLAYGRLGEAAGLLRDALQREPERIDLGVQLLEVLGRQGDTPIYDEQENRLRQLGVEDQRLQEIRARYPKLASAAPLAAAAPVIAALPIEPPVEPEPEDNFELNLDQLSMASSWDLEETRSTTDAPEQAPSTLGSDLQVLPQDFELPETLPDDAETAELEWIAEPEAQPLDEDFLNEFGDPGTSLSLEPLELQAPESEPSDAANAGKLEQAQTCIDDGDLDSAIALLNELLKEADEPLKQTARTLLAGIR